jgi:hypothetical protein
VYVSSENPPATAVAAPDFYSVVLAAGESLSVGLDALDELPIAVEIQDENGAVLQSGVLASDRLGEDIDEFIAPAAGTYYVVVRGPFQQTYNFVAVKSASLEFEPNHALGIAQTLPASGVVIGGIDGVDIDWYRFEAVAGQRLHVETELPPLAVVTRLNMLDSAVDLFDSSGNLVANNDNRAAGDPSSSLNYVVPTSGVYYVRVRSAQGSGEYVLRVGDATPGTPGDTDGDGDVDLTDLNNVRNGFGGTGLGDTYPYDGVVGLADLNAVRNYFGTSAPAPVTRPTVVPLPRFTASSDVELPLRSAASVPLKQASDALFALIGSAPSATANRTERRIR